ncbi:hypothetical protein Vadar_004622 [Vaccinium darrowii]|uniref:Uncharacterized protein n=1 Tax=Vaccinium darrowii TaxID=229202 RepID=A0ACB7YCU4_9ERIC|nr:hypothetical protein Vadar_004622 [Vaccinium darrowii]
MDTILCDELLEEVLRRLPPRSKFSSSSADVSLVSKRWFRLYRSSRSQLYVRISPDDCTPHSFTSFLSHFPNLVHLFITIDGGHATSNFSDQILLSVASSCPKLRSLRLDSQPVSVLPVLSLSTSCPLLSTLIICLSRPPSFHWLLLFHSLIYLFVRFASVPGEFKHVDDASKGNFDAELKLETLTLCGIQRSDFYGFDCLWKSCRNLKRLSLRGCEGIGDDTAVSSFVNSFKALQEVDLRNCGEAIVNEILSGLVESCTSLNSLIICGECSKEGLLQFITHSRCNLQKLDLRLPSDLEDNHLMAVVEKFKGLSSLRLDGCYLVTGEGLKTMALAMSSKLEELALINCEVEPELLATLGQRFRNLRKLDLSHNVMLVDNEFISMLALCNCLRELKVRGCEGLTNASVISMVKSCTQLESVDITKCPGIDAEAVELLVLKCLRLRKMCVEEGKLSDVSRLWASEKLIRVVV